MEKMTFAAACIKFGLKLPNETPGEFGRQIKALTTEDRAWFADRFAKEHHIEITNPVI